MCGNGARCICRYGYEHQLAGETQTIEDHSGACHRERIDARNYRIRLPQPQNLQYLALDVDGKRSAVCTSSSETPAFRTQWCSTPDFARRTTGAGSSLDGKLRYHPAFPKGANVNFLEKLGENRFYERTWERGVEDFTYACGTGTGASVYALAESRQCGDHVQVEMKGGLLIVDIVREGKKCTDLLLTGPASLVCEGEVFEEAIPQEAAFGCV